MLAFAASATIFSIFMFCWTLIMARDPKTWRLWFMALFVIIDMKSTRDERRRSEAQLSVISWILAVIFFLGIIGSVYVVVIEIQGEKSPRTQLEMDQEKTMKDIEMWRQKFKKLR